MAQRRQDGHQDVGDVAEKARLRLLRPKKTADDENLTQLLAKVRQQDDYRQFVPQDTEIKERYNVDYFADIDPSQLTVWQPIEPPKSIVRNVFLDLGGKNLEEQLTSAAFSNLGDLQFQNYCATLIQKSWRQYRIRKAYRQVVMAVVSLQRWWRRVLKTRLRSFRVRNKAALIVQKFFRVWRDRRIFDFYKELVTTREKLDPKILLKAINPRETELLDPAAGLHIRLRLGGHTWPPLIFYKIFTHTTIIDINAFAPRNYAQEQAEKQKLAALEKASKMNGPVPDSLVLLSTEPELREYVRPDGTVGVRDVRGWYNRVENNGWRPLADRLLLEDRNLGARDTKILSKITYQPFAVLRKEERKRIMKQRKVEWMRKMYAMKDAADAAAAAALPSQSSLATTRSIATGQGASARNSTASLRQGASAQASHNNSVSLKDAFNEEDEYEEEDEDLLKWTQALDFDSYADTWHSTAVTLSTQAHVNSRLYMGQDKERFMESVHNTEFEF